MIEFVNAGFSHGQAPVLRDLSMTLEAGDFVVVAGPAGSGKSTLIALAHAALMPDRGHLRFFGKGLGPRNRRGISDLRRAVGSVPEAPPFLAHLPLVDNIALPLRVNGIDPASRSGDVTALLEWAGLRPHAEALPAAVPAPVRRRAALARAVVLSPKAVLVDAPPAAADPEAARFLTLLAELNRSGVAVLVATRDPELAHVVRAQVPGARVRHLADGRLA